MFFRHIAVFCAFKLVTTMIYPSDLEQEANTACKKPNVTLGENPTHWEDLSIRKIKRILDFSAVAFDRYRKPENFEALQKKGHWTNIKEFSGTTGYCIPCKFGFMASKPQSSSSPAEVMIAFRGIEMNRYELPDLIQIHGSFFRDIFHSWRGNGPNASDLLSIKGTIPFGSLSFLSSVEKDLTEKLDESLKELSLPQDCSSHADTPIRITLTGATFGGTLAALAAPLVQKHLREKGKNNFSIRTITFGAANFGDAEFKKEYDKNFPLLDIKIPDPALSGISNISARLAKTQNLGTIITLSPVASTASVSSTLGTYWSNLKSYFCPPPFSPLVFNQPTFRLDTVCVEDFSTRPSEIYDALKKMEKSQRF
jgi:hypothetical protein